MESKTYSLRGVVARTAVVHTVTYFLAGILAMNLFDYAGGFAQGAMSAWMRPVDDPLVMAGVLFQPLRGALFGIIFYLLRDILFARTRGWLVNWAMLAVVGIFSTFGPAPASIEGLIYTKIPTATQLSGGLLEVLTQSFLLAAVTTWWVNHPERKWLGALLAAAFVLVLAMSALGLWATAAGLA